jgi:hypothetical protein
VENQSIKGFKSLCTDWWGKYTSGILILILFKEHGIMLHCIMAYTPRLNEGMEHLAIRLIIWKMN